MSDEKKTINKILENVLDIKLIVIENHKLNRNNVKIQENYKLLQAPYHKDSGFFYHSDRSLQVEFGNSIFRQSIRASYSIIIRY